MGHNPTEGHGSNMWNSHIRLLVESEEQETKSSTLGGSRMTLEEESGQACMSYELVRSFSDKNDIRLVIACQHEIWAHNSCKYVRKTCNRN